MKKTKLITAFAATLAGFVITATSASAAVLVDEDFQTGADNTEASGNLTGWSITSGKFKTRITTADVPEDDNVGTNVVLQMENTGGNMGYNTTHNWAATDTFTLSMNVSPQAWNLDKQRYIRPEIKQVSDDAVLWDPGENLTGPNKTALPTATGLGWNGPGLHGDPGGLDGTTWQNSPQADVLLTWTIDASAFSTGSAGEAIYLEIDMSGQQRGLYIDNVLLETVVVPEPTTTALLGLGGLALILRRRK